jgi:serine/threonine protein kinase
MDLQRPYYYEGIAKLVHVMFLGYGGAPISRQWKSLDQLSALRQVESCMRAIHALGVLHRDVMPRNILWNCDSGEATVIDFERAKIGPARPVLGPLSTNRKRKQKNESNGQKHTGCAERLFAQEMAELREEISCL